MRAAHEPSGEALVAWARSTFAGPDWSRARFLSGAFHQVLLTDDVVLRAAHGSGHDERAGREAAVLRAWDGLDVGVHVPRLLGGPVSGAAWTAYPVSRVRGGTAAPQGLGELLDAYAEVLTGLDVVPVPDGLPEPRAWCGGSRFASAVARLPVEVVGPHRAVADRVVGELVALPPPGRRQLVHGDFGPHNLLWSRSRAVSLIDLDHACAGDRAVDLAPLVGLHGAAAVTSIASEAAVHRAMVHRATLSLQVAAAAHLAHRPALRDHALATFARRAGEGTLHDPEGAVPAGWRRTG